MPGPAVVVLPAAGKALGDAIIAGAVALGIVGSGYAAKKGGGYLGNKMAEADRDADRNLSEEAEEECEKGCDREKPYEGQTPTDKPGDYRNVKGSPGQENVNDGSYWEKDRTQHGGSTWKRWPSRRDHQRGRGRESIRPDGSVR